MEEVAERHGPEWLPDDAFFKETVALALLFKSAGSIVRKAKLQSYGAQVTAFAISKLSADYEEEVDLGLVWESQSVPDRIVRAFGDWAPRIHAQIVSSAGMKNVGEWCKKDECWDHVRALTLDLPPAPSPEQPSAATRRGTLPISEDPVVFCKSLDGPTWARVMEWSAHPGRIATYDRQVAHSIAGLALNGWEKAPSAKQARFGARVLRAAAEAGIIG